ncbi:flagellar assembly protein FliW [Botrimarina hoheduenensis]|uniref:Flagellar assembly factor FliW n=1 Tax=Botrimarina hoheduenensis TaxID=2528000 RepID=A0A5C5VVS8_9BACT|nr:flagellar assembly protein FliW [Botrimarina hoheduenensis]TWT42694.1 Flagellar assembly factor FliW [Botrimarina hoheduenensis]
MQINTTRFGAVEIRSSDIIDFPLGLIGLEGCRRWVVFADAQNEGLGWLQSLDRAEVALAIVSPRRFVSGYRVRVAARDLQVLEAPQDSDLQVVVSVSHHDSGPQGGGLSLNLKAPLVVCLETRRGRQIIAKDDHPVRHWLGRRLPMRRSA